VRDALSSFLVGEALAAAGVSASSDPEEWSSCRLDFVRCCGRWFKTYDPRRNPPIVPFELWPRQREFVEWWFYLREKRLRGVVVKPRDVGFSWLTAALAVHGWLFEPGFKLTYGSYKEDRVDVPGNMDSWFEKVRFVIKNLPPFLVPPGFSDSWLMKRNIVNRANGASVTGEIGDNMGRGGRATVYVADEFAHVERSDAVEASLSHVADTVVYGSTPKGTDNAFYRKAVSGIPRFDFRWHDNPRASFWRLPDGTEGHGWPGPEGAVFPYLEEMRSSLSPASFAEEVMADFYASSECSVFDKRWVEAAMTFCPEAHGWKPSGPVVAGVDLAAGGANKTRMVVRQGPKVVAPVFGIDEADGTKVAAALKRECERLKVSVLVMDAHGVGRSAYDALRSMRPQFAVVPYFAGAAASDRPLPGGLRARHVYANRRTETAFHIRDRAERTWSLVTGAAKPDPAACLALCGETSIAEGMSLARYEESSSGKTALVPKKRMKAESLVMDSFDALCMAFSVDRLPTFGTARIV
jgi:hypothetical protein